MIFGRFDDRSESGRHPAAHAVEASSRAQSESTPGERLPRTVISEPES
jgi:hypothetical protein